MSAAKGVTLSGSLWQFASSDFATSECMHRNDLADTALIVRSEVDQVE